MKKSFLFSALASVALLSACSNDESVAYGGDNADETKQQIVLQVANTGDGLQTRAGRPLYSSEAKQSIENVKVIICDKDGKVAYTVADNAWQNNSTAYTTNGHGRQKTITIPEDSKLAEGEYTVYAFGYSDDSDYSDLATEISNIAKDGKFSENTVLSIATGVKGEEIFAGSLTLTVKDGVGFKTPVVLNRQVAGTFGYFDNIPYEEGATKLQLVASTRNTQLVLGQFASYDLENNGKDNTGHINYVVNGTTAATGDNANVIYSITLADWFGTVADANSDGLIDTDNWAIPTSYSGKANFKKGSVFGGEFLIPFQKVADASTFTLQLVDDNGNVKKKWTVNLASTDLSTSLTAWNGSDAFSAVADYSETTSIYSVVRNHLYGIGEKTLDNPTDPDNPDPSTPEEPEPLAKKQQLTLRVNDNWEVLHKMTVEED